MYVVDCGEILVSVSPVVFRSTLYGVSNCVQQLDRTQPNPLSVESPYFPDLRSSIIILMVGISLPCRKVPLTRAMRELESY